MTDHITNNPRGRLFNITLNGDCLQDKHGVFMMWQWRWHRNQGLVYCIFWKSS